MTDAHGDQMTYAQVDHEMAKAHEDHLIHPDRHPEPKAA